MASNPLRSSPFSPTEIWQELQKHLSYWQAPERLDVLSQLFSKALNNQSHSSNTITRCVCIGVGAFQPHRSWPEIIPEEIEDLVHDALDQMAFLTALLPLLRNHHNIDEVYFQDPIYNDVEISFLRDQLGHTVLETPHAFDKITTETFVFAPYVPENVVAEALERAHPALYVGNSVVEWTQKLRTQGPSGPRGVEVGTESGAPMVETYARFGEVVDVWPLRVNDARMGWCADTFIHWRRSQEEKAASGS